MHTIKYYMNNPCEIIRKISEDFSEVKVYPRFMDEELSGAGWCTACMIGGTSSHTCEPYQEVIDVIAETKAAMIIVVENRLLHDEPVEFHAWRTVRAQTESLKKEREELTKLNRETAQETKRLSEYLVALKEQIHDAEYKRENEYGKYLGLKRACETMEDTLNRQQYKIDTCNGFELAMNVGKLRSLFMSDLVLQHLQLNGVDNWDGYEIPEDIEEQVNSELSGLRFKLKS